MNSMNLEKVTVDNDRMITGPTIIDICSKCVLQI